MIIYKKIAVLKKYRIYSIVRKSDYYTHKERTLLMKNFYLTYLGLSYITATCMLSQHTTWTQKSTNTHFFSSIESRASCPMGITSGDAGGHRIKKNSPCKTFFIKSSDQKNWSALIIAQGDILKQKVEAIVNAANDQLLGGGGVCGAIFKAAGWEKLQAECFTYTKNAQGVRCATGDAVTTSSGALKKRGISNIIHAVGPDCRVIKDPRAQKSLLASAYTRSLEEATALSLKSIAFPFISSAIFACPADLAATTALEAIRDFMSENPKNSLNKIVLVLFSKESYDLFVAKARNMFPTKRYGKASGFCLSIAQ